MEISPSACHKCFGVCNAGGKITVCVSDQVEKKGYKNGIAYPVSGLRARVGGITRPVNFLSAENSLSN